MLDHTVIGHTVPGQPCGEDEGLRDPRWSGVVPTTIDVQGTPVFARYRHGPTDGVPHILLHGLGGSSGNWLDLMAPLSEFGPCLAIDLPGFGRTPPPSPHAARVNNQVGFMAALLRTIGWDRVVLHGNSMGGLIATQFAAQHPDLIEGLVLAAPALPPPPRALHRTQAMAVGRFLPFAVPPVGRGIMRMLWGKGDPEKVYAATTKILFSDPDRLRSTMSAVGVDNIAFAATAKWRGEAIAEAAESIIAAWLAPRRTFGFVDAVNAPTLLVWGQKDRLIHPEIVDHLELRRPDWTVHRRRDTGHSPMQEFPARYAATVLDWLAVQPAAQA